MLTPLGTPAPQSCPRCGYDLSGTIATWRESCPLDGTCSECGLSFAWRDVLNPRHSVATWSFEHALSRPARRWFQTLLRSFWPLRFWRQLRMEHPVVTRRLALYIFPLVALAWIILGVSTVLVVLYSRSVPARPGAFAPPPLPTGYLLSVLAFPFHDLPLPYGSYAPLGIASPWARWALETMLWILLMPASFLMLAETLGKAGVRKAHLLRATVYLAALAIIVVPIRGLADLCDAGMITRSGRVGIVAFILAPLARLAGAFIALFPMLWWFCVVRTYLKLPHAAGVALVVWLVPRLAAYALLYYSTGSLG